MKMIKEDAPLIFHRRFRVADVKISIREKYDILECEACGLEEEKEQWLNVRYSMETHMIKLSNIAHEFDKNIDIFGKMKKGEVWEKDCGKQHMCLDWPFRSPYGSHEE